jgi:hypothetical protein
MSNLVFNQTASPYNGLIQRLETNIYGDDGLGRISGNSKLLGLWTTRLNIARDKADSIILASDGQWQGDDKNHSDISIILTDLVANQRYYTIDTDEQGNEILEIHRAYILQNGIYTLLEPIDETKYPAFYNGQDATGVSSRYGKRGNAVVLEYPSASNVTDGLKLDITRTSEYFTTVDTTKKAGLGLYDVYLADWATFEYAGSNSLANTNITFQRIQMMEQEMQDYFSRRNQDTPKRLAVYPHNNK